ncbi:MAG: hypothetical protein ACT6FE_05205 [Methanosarcinaceae archaeon]
MVDLGGGMDTRTRLKEQRKEMFRSNSLSIGFGFIIGMILGFIMALGAQNYSSIGLNSGSALIIIAFGLGMLSVLVSRYLAKKKS